MGAGVGVGVAFAVLLDWDWGEQAVRLMAATNAARNTASFRFIGSPPFHITIGYRVKNWG